MEYRLALSDVERGVDVAETVIVGLDPREAREHLTLRVLAWCLLHQPRLEFGRGAIDPDEADLSALDLTGHVATWIECGAVTGEKLRHVLRHRRGARVHVVLDDPAEREAPAAELARAKQSHEVTWWLIDRALVTRLAAGEQRRHKWAVTIVGEHLYVDAEGISYDGPYTRS